MATRAERDRLEVRRDPRPEVVTDREDPAPGPADVPAEPAAPAAEAPAGDEYVEPDLYGVRVSWQSEAVKIEAAEFLVATRVQEDSRRRLARVFQRLREAREENRQP